MHAQQCLYLYLSIRFNIEGYIILNPYMYYLILNLFVYFMKCIVLYTLPILRLYCYTFCRVCPAVSVVFNFGYLFFFRSMHLLGFEPFTGPTNAVQLILTLKVCII